MLLVSLVAIGGNGPDMIRFGDNDEFVPRDVKAGGTLPLNAGSRPAGPIADAATHTAQ